MSIDPETFGKNPLAVIGISREALRGLTPGEAGKLISAAYRAQANIHHPDLHQGEDQKTKHGKRMTELSQAQEELGDPEALELYMKEYLKVTNFQQEIDQANGRAGILENRFQSLQERMLDYATARATNRPGTVFNLGGHCEIQVYDIGDSLNTGGNMTCDVTASSWSRDTVLHQGAHRLYLKTLTVDPTGVVVKDGERTLSEGAERVLVATASPSDQGGHLTSEARIKKLGLSGLDPSTLLTSADTVSTARSERYNVAHIEKHTFAKAARFFESGLSSPKSDEEFVLLFSLNKAPEGQRTTYRLEGVVLETKLVDPPSSEGSSRVDSSKGGDATEPSESDTRQKGNKKGKTPRKKASAKKSSSRKKATTKKKGSSAVKKKAKGDSSTRSSRTKKKPTTED